MNIMDWVNQIYLEEICLAIAGAIIGGVTVFAHHQIFKRLLTPVKEETEPEEELEEFPAEKISREERDRRTREMMNLIINLPRELETPLFQDQVEEPLRYPFQFEAERRLILLRICSTNGGFPKNTINLDRAVNSIFERLEMPFEVIGQAKPCENGQQLTVRIKT